MSKLSAGRRPLSSKPTQSAALSESDVFGNTFSLDPALIKELKDKNLAYRFASAKELYANQGYHKRNWKVYKRQSSDTMGSRDFLTGGDPEGVIRRGDSILVTKPMEDFKKHRALLNQKATRLKAAAGRQHAEELRETAREHGIRTQISEGYEDDHSEGDGE